MQRMNELWTLSSGTSNNHSQAVDTLYGTVTQKDLIKRVRKCKTAAEERQTLAKESASIRTAIKEEASRNRTINVSKLLYLNLLFFPTQYGQMECLKVAASEKVHEKRLGYLAASLLIEEQSPILTLVVNCLKNDLNSSNGLVVSLALNTFLSIGRQETMVQDLLPDIQRLLHHEEVGVRKKAALACVKIIQTFPDMIECFVDELDNIFLNQTDHSMLLCIAAMLRGFITVEPTFKYKFTKFLPQITKIIQTVLQESFLTEYEINGIPDPFLLCTLLELIRMIIPGIEVKPADDVDNYQSIVSDCLIFMVGIIDEGKSAANCILYEVVKIILNFPSPEHSLILLAVNILGKFISHSDHNLRFVALELLGKFAKIDVEAVQHHRERIFECISDPDPSIKHAAVQLMFEVVGKETWRMTISELSCFFLDCSNEMKKFMIRKLIDCLNQYANDDFDFYKTTVLKILKNSNGIYLADDLIDSIANSIAAQKETAKRLFLNNVLMSELSNVFTNRYLGLLSFYLIGSSIDLIFDCPLLVSTLVRLAQNNAPNKESYFNADVGTDITTGEASPTSPVKLANVRNEFVESATFWARYLDCLFKVCCNFHKPDVFCRIASQWINSEDFILSNKSTLYCNALKLEHPRLGFDSLNYFNSCPVPIRSTERHSFNCGEFAIYVKQSLDLPDDRLISGAFIFVFLCDEQYPNDLSVEAAVTNDFKIHLTKNNEPKLETFGDFAAFNFKITAMTDSASAKELKVKLKFGFDLVSKKDESVSNRIDRQAVISIKQKELN